MKILLQPYNTYRQNNAGGVQTRVSNFRKTLENLNYEVNIFNSSTDKISEYDIIHFFKASLDHYNLLCYAKSKNIPCVLSSIVALEGLIKIRLSIAFSNIFGITTAQKIIQKSLNLFDMIFTETEKERIFIHRAYGIPFDKTIAIPNGIPNNIIAEDNGSFREKYNLHNDYVLQVGRIDKNKNQLNVIRALNKTDISVVFIGGSDPSDEEYFRQCKKEATANMIFTGWIDNNDPLITSAYRNAKVVVLPSKKEIYGNSVFEGLANNCNLVVTNELPMHEWNLDKYVYSINPNNIYDIKEKIIKALDNETKDVSREIIENFSWLSITKKNIDIYNRILLKYK